MWALILRGNTCWNSDPIRLGEKFIIRGLLTAKENANCGIWLEVAGAWFIYPEDLFNKEGNRSHS